MNNYWEKANHSWTSDSIRFIETPSKRSRDLFYYVQEIGHFKAYKPYYTERANLNSFLIKYTIKGEGKLIYRGKTYKIKPHDLFFINCNDYQYYETTSEEPWEMGWIHFNGANTHTFFDEFFNNTTPILHSHNTKIEGLLNKLLTLHKDKNASTDFTISLLIHELLNEVIMDKHSINFTSNEIPDYVLETKSFLDNHITQKISMTLLEQQFMINKYQLNKEFSKYIGIPPIEYHITNKINYSKDLLRYSNFSVKEISYEVGIENVAYFSRLFKKKTGTTPITFRKNG